MRFKGYSYTVVGSREMNQDSLLVDNDRGLYAVADGVGGGLRGEVASLMAVTGVGAHPGDPSRLRDTIQTIQAAVLAEALESIGEALMGTTLTCALVRGDEVEICHVGDSRCYHYTGGTLKQITEDHEAFDESLQSPVLASYLGIPPEVHPLRIQEEVIKVAPGDRILLCSDGLYKQISEVEMATAIRTCTDPDTMLQTIVNKAARAEYSDNVTVVYIELDA